MNDVHCVTRPVTSISSFVSFQGQKCLECKIDFCLGFLCVSIRYTVQHYSRLQSLRRWCPPRLVLRYSLTFDWTHFSQGSFLFTSSGLYRRILRRVPCCLRFLCLVPRVSPSSVLYSGLSVLYRSDVRWDV